MNAVPRPCHPCRRLGEKDSEKDSLIRWKKDALQIIKFFPSFCSSSKAERFGHALWHKYGIAKVFLLLFVNKTFRKDVLSLVEWDDDF